MRPGDKLSDLSIKDFLDVHYRCGILCPSGLLAMVTALL
jgi:hypothetical protein